MIRCAKFISVLLLGAGPQCTAAADQAKSPYEVRIGTLEMTSDIKRLYVFRWNSSEEVFDFSTAGKPGAGFPGLPDLEEIGFKTASGKVFKYEGKEKGAYLEKFFKDHPDEVMEFFIFRGLLDQSLELKSQRHKSGVQG